MKQRDHALVIGGGMAGLLAARVLSDHFQRVTIVERDDLPAEIGSRKGVPQAHHVHALLAGGRKIFEKYFPGLDAELVANGAEIAWAGHDAGWLGPFGWTIPFSPPLPMRLCSRDFLEWHVRRRVSAIPNVHLAAGRGVERLIAADGRVVGVGLQGGEPLSADLVVDTSGRSSRAPQWLRDLGYESPQETIVDAFVGYASRVYEGQLTLPNGWKTLLVAWSPPRHTRAAGTLPLEGGNRFRVTLIGGGGDYPPTDEAGFLEFARGMHSPVIYDTIKNARPLEPIYGNRSTQNRLRHYEKLRRLPKGFILMGDSVCSFNPLYGQGMAIAGMEAELLGESLLLPELEPLAFQKKLAGMLTDVWMATTTEDFRFPGTTGARSPALRFMHRYMEGVARLALEDPVVARTMFRVIELEEPAKELLKPNIVLRALPRALFRRGAIQDSYPTPYAPVPAFRAPAI